jgi:phosphonate transport system permease protein
MSTRWQEIQTLHRERPRRPFVTWSIRMMAVIVAVSWWVGDFNPAGWLTDRRVTNLQRFLGELQPWPVRQEGWDSLQVLNWARDLWSSQGAEAFVATLAISVVAIVLAGGMGALSSLFAARNLANAEPVLPSGCRPGKGRKFGWQVVNASTRAGLVIIRAVPEYVWAFLFMALFGANALPMVLALALHNAGILGKLSAELIENLDNQSLPALRAAGASRFQMVWAGILPLTLPRFLLYFFYRWETCVREATVLGMLGMASLGLLIVDSRARNRYDEMIFFILLGAVLVMLGDLVSAMLRRYIRKA